MTESLKKGNNACKNICMNIFIVIAIMVSLKTLTDKIDDKDLKNRGNCWMRTLKTLAPDGPNIGPDGLAPDGLSIPNVSDQILYIPHIIKYKGF